MNDLLDTALSVAEIGALPDRLRWRYWAGEIGEGVPGLTPLKSRDVRHDCRNWLAWQRDLSAGDRVRYVGICLALQNKVGEVRARSDDGVSISVSGFADTFLVDPRDLRAENIA